MTTGNPILQVKNLEVRRGGVAVLTIPEFTLAGGGVLGLIGPNGAGKSTFLLALARLLKLHRGEILFRGRKIDTNHGLLEYRRKLAMVFQESLLFDATVFDNVASGLKIRGMPAGDVRNITGDYLERFGIGHLGARSARKLSGGEAQRTSLARAFATRPEILFLDEPFSSLDPPTRESLIEDLEKNLRETGTTAVMATHDQLEALRLSDTIALMHQGKIVQSGSPENVMNHPMDTFVATFVGMETIFTGPVIRTGGGVIVLSVSGHEIEAAGNAGPGDRITCCIRPEHVTLSTASPGDATSARNVFPGHIVKIIPLGLFHKVNIDCGFSLTAYVTGQSLENLSLHEGKNVYASFKATSLHIIRKDG
jgi:tungstate transport system ATP-binding protein